MAFRLAGAFGVGLMVAMVPTFWINALASGNPFVTARSGDLVGLSISNFYNNQGVYRVGHGSFRVFSDVLFQRLVTIPWVWLLGVLGVSLLPTGIGLGAMLWVLATLVSFSLWLNPYDRYMISAMPMAVLLVTFGFMQVVIRVRRHVQWLAAVAIVVAAAVLALTSL